MFLSEKFKSMKQASTLRLKGQIKLSNFKKEKNKKQNPKKLKTEKI